MIATSQTFCCFSTSWSSPTGFSEKTMSSPSKIAKGSLPTIGLAVKIACPSPNALRWRIVITSTRLLYHSFSSNSNFSCSRNGLQGRGESNNLPLHLSLVLWQKWCVQYQHLQTFGRCSRCKDDPTLGAFLWVRIWLRAKILSLNRDGDDCCSNTQHFFYFDDWDTMMLSSCCDKYVIHSGNLGDCLNFIAFVLALPQALQKIDQPQR